MEAEEDDLRELASSLRTDDDVSGLGVDESIEVVGLGCAPLPSRSFFNNVGIVVGTIVGASVAPIVGGSNVGAAVPLPLNPHSRQFLNVNEIDLLASGALTFRI